MIEIIFTVALCYLAAGVYVIAVFDAADHSQGLDTSGFIDQVPTVLCWPHFLYFVANQEAYRITKDSVDRFRDGQGDQ
jgi:hypothetical protein